MIAVRSKFFCLLLFIMTISVGVKNELIQLFPTQIDENRKRFTSGWDRQQVFATNGQVCLFFLL